MKGEARKKSRDAADYIFEMEVYIDGEKVETIKSEKKKFKKKHKKKERKKNINFRV